MAVNTTIQFRRGTADQWSTAPTGVGRGILAAGELGLETDTGKFKIGRNGLVHWNDLPYAGGSVLSNGSGVCIVYNSGTNSYEISSELFSSGSGISLTSTACGSGSGNAYTISLNNRLQEVSKLSSSGIIVSTNSSGVTTRSITAGNNIQITNGDGISANPAVALSGSLSGIDNIAASSLSLSGSGQALYINNDAYIGGTLSATQINLNGISVGNNVTISGNLSVNGSGTFGSGLYVSGTPVSLSGHTHSYSSINNFCSGVADCVNTALLFASGVQGTYSSGTGLTVKLSGQALALHNYTGTGILVRSSDSTYVARTISNSDSNLNITNGNGASANPTIDLASSLNLGSISTTGNVTIGGNLVVNGDTVTTNVSTITVEDPIIVLGQPSGNIDPSDVKDRGLELRYNVGGVASTGFIGYDQSSGVFTLLTSAVNSNEIFTGTLGSLSIGALSATGLISGRILTSTVASGTSPLSITSPTLVSNLNSDLLDSQHGSYYLDWNNFSNIPDPLVSVALSGDVAGTGSVTWTNLSGNLSIGINAIVQPDSVALGTDTTGNYAASVGVSGSGLSITGSAGEGTTFTVNSNATPASVTGTIVSRDSNGNFSANIITASLSGNASTATSATNININSNTSTDTSTYLVLVGNNATGDQLPIIDSGLSFNANTNILSTTQFSGEKLSLATNTLYTALSIGLSGDQTFSVTSSGTLLLGVHVSDTSAPFRVNNSGIITDGTWNGSTIAVNYGGTGATNLSGVIFGNGASAMTALAATSAYQFLRRNSTNDGYEFTSTIDGGTP